MSSESNAVPAQGGAGPAANHQTSPETQATPEVQAIPAVDKPAEKPAAPKGIGAMAGAMFLMATSAIGPGFLTQTSVFTVQMGAAFAFAIALSIIVDVAIQLNVWRVLAISGMRANELGNTVLPGLGWFLAVLVFIGGIVFNIGNIAGTGLGINAMLGIDARLGGIIAAAIAVLVFLSKRCLLYTSPSPRD